MSQSPYQITTDPSRKLVAMSFDPVFWHQGVSDDFVRDCMAAVVSLGCHRTELLILVDLRNAVIQSKDVYDQMLALVSAASARRIALVAAAPLARMQTKRLQIRDDVLMFEELFAATNWLFDQGQPAAAA